MQISSVLFLIRIVGGGVHTVSTRHVGHFWPIVPALGDCEDREFGGMKIGRGNQSTRRKVAPTPNCPPQIPLDQTRTRTRASSVRSLRLTASAMARPHQYVYTPTYKDCLPIRCNSSGGKYSFFSLFKVKGLYANEGNICT
jgi:hypothetical protein